MAEEAPETQPDERRGKFTLHPREFDEAVREVWAAKPPEKDGSKKKTHADGGDGDATEPTPQ